MHRTSRQCICTSCSPMPRRITRPRSSSRPHAYTPNVRLRLEMGRHILAEDYVRASRGRAVLRRDVDRALNGVDALLLPSLAIEAPPIGAASVPVKGGTGTRAQRDAPMHAALQRHGASCDQHCRVAPRAPGCPIGLQLVGHAGRTADLLHVARAVEQALGALMLDAVLSPLGAASRRASAAPSGSSAPSTGASIGSRSNGHTSDVAPQHARAAMDRRA